MTSTVERGSTGPEQPWWGGPPPRGPYVPPAWAGPVAPDVPAGLGPVPPGRPVTGTGPRRGWVVLGIVGALLGVAMLGATAAAHRTMDVTGAVTLTSTYTTLTPHSACNGAGLYRWLDSGTPVTITDADGEIVGAGVLGNGTSGSGTSWSGYSSTCTFAFSIDGVAARDDFYRIAVGSGATGGVPFSRAQLEDGPVSITY